MGNMGTAYLTAATSSAPRTDFEDKLNLILRVLLTFLSDLYLAIICFVIIFLY